MRRQVSAIMAGWRAMLALAGIASVALASAGCSGKVLDVPKGVAMGGSESMYDFTMKTIDGHERKLSEYRGKVLLVVNVASKCGFTPQYEGLEALYRMYRARGFVILGFPANNFMHQEPGTDAEILTFCRTRYDVTFDLFSKISVNGDDIHPLYAYLTERSPVPGKITWNFNKFLVDREGHVVARFDSKVAPMSKEITDRVEGLLGKP
ncbi:MAG: glutathione peroxidase [Candidatus Coatesbacteria bacterium]